MLRLRSFMSTLLMDNRYDDQQILDYLRRELWGYPKLLEEFHMNVKPALALAHDQNEKDSERWEQSGEGVLARGSHPPNPPARNRNHEESLNISVSSLMILGEPTPNARSGSPDPTQSYARPDDEHPRPTPKSENTEMSTPTLGGPSLQHNILGIGEASSTHVHM